MPLTYIKSVLGLLCPCLFMIIVPVTVMCQTSISRVEYFIDRDPGLGKGNAVTLPATATANIANATFAIPTTIISSLSAGTHTVYIRAKNAAGKWTLTNTWVFVKPVTVAPATNISYAEYFIDTDPGRGHGTPVIFTAATDVANLSATLPANKVTSLAAGVHTLFIRAKDAANKWSLSNTWVFLKPVAIASATSITMAEYYIDTDPGKGKATPISITPNSNLASISFTLPTNKMASLAFGLHTIYVRAKDTNNRWGLTNTWQVIKPVAANALPNLAAVEYYIDKDPGKGKGKKLTIPAATNAPNITQQLSLTGLAQGKHILFIRAQDSYGKWSLTDTLSFTIKASAPGVAIIVNTGAAKAGFFDASVYPNPAITTARLQVTGVTGNCVVEILTEDGKVLWHQQAQASGLLIVDLPTTSYSAGVYLVHVTDGTHIKTLKLIKQ